MPDDLVVIKELIGTAIPDFHVETAVFEGEGDFCRAYTVNDRWIFRFAHNSEGSRSVEREAALLPLLVPSIGVPIPGPAYFGHHPSSGYSFVGYRKIAGVELARGRLNALNAREQEECIATIAGFLRDLHAFDTGRARQLGIPETGYPFARTEEGIIGGNAADIYHDEAARLTSYADLDEGTRTQCRQLSGQLIEGTHNPVLPPALTHGDLSQDHVLFDPQTHLITGIIDFSDAIITTPLLDYVYLYHTYGSDFLSRLLGHLHGGNVAAITKQVQLLHGWYLIIRLLWTLDHGYAAGIDPRLRELKDALRLINASAR